MSFSYGGSGLTGRFVVLEALYGSGGQVLKFAADFEQHCNDATPARFGAIRFNSAIAAIPFGGTYPSYVLTVPTPSNGTATSINVNGPKVCGARFEPDASSPRTLVVFDSKAGDTVGGGKPNVYSTFNSRITATMNSSSQLSFNIVSLDATRDVSWTIGMNAPTGQTLAVGTYEGALSSAGQRPALQVNFCGGGHGRFVIRELVPGAGTAGVLRYI